MKRLTVEEFEKKANEVHNWRYKYFGDYINAHTPINIECPIHGIFPKTPNHHLSGQGCPLCKDRSNTAYQNFVFKANRIHFFKYDYSKFVYVNNKTPGIIICPIHGEFPQTPDNHLHNHGCSKCSGNKKKTTKEFVDELKGIFGDKYDYSNVDYKGAFTPVRIECPLHGVFKKDPHHLLTGSGCKQCTSSKLENEMRLFLKRNYKGLIMEQYKFDWLEKQRLDFYLPRMNIAIECQGIQHFEPREYFGGEEEFQKSIERDKRKRQLCNDNGVKLIYYSNLKINFPYEVITNLEDMKKIISK